MPVEKKKFWLSKTFWVNALAILAAVVAYFTGWEAPATVIAPVLGFVNLILRAVTKSEITWSAGDDSGMAG